MPLHPQPDRLFHLTRLKPDFNRSFTEATLPQKPCPLAQSIALVTRRSLSREGADPASLPPRCRSDDGGYVEHQKRDGVVQMRICREALRIALKK